MSVQGTAPSDLGTEDKQPDQEDYMRENKGNESSVQNRFTAYLMSAVKHKCQIELILPLVATLLE